MAVSDFKAKISNLDDALKGAVKYAKDNKNVDDLSVKKIGINKIYDYKTKKADYYANSVEASLKELKKTFSSIALENEHPENESVISELALKFRQIEKIKEQKEQSLKKYEEIRFITAEIKEIAAELKETPRIKNISIVFEASKLPEAIRNDVSADIAELQSCFNNKCYRSSIFLCGKILETALHRKFYEKTGRDILETQPGIGLGTLVAKLKEKNIVFDPGITQQLHLINQIRIFSVHKKKEAFMPSKEQAHATILYTVDILKKLFV